MIKHTLVALFIAAGCVLSAGDAEAQQPFRTFEDCHKAKGYVAIRHNASGSNGNGGVHAIFSLYDMWDNNVTTNDRKGVELAPGGFARIPVIWTSPDPNLHPYMARVWIDHTWDSVHKTIDSQTINLPLSRGWDCLSLDGSPGRFALRQYCAR